MTTARACPVVLTIAGSDSGGGAGVQADLKTFHRLGVFGTSAITAITAQNTQGVMRWAPVEAGLVRAQIDAVATDLAPRAVKSGMLGNAAIVSVVADAIAGHGLHPYVLDPVMVASSGDALLSVDAVDAIRARLVPLADLVTPNLDEAEALTGGVVRDVDAMTRAGRALVERGARAALIKGGHLTGDTVIDVLVTADGVKTYSAARVASRHTHGTGCTLSAAIAAGLATGATLDDAVVAALAFVRRAIETAPRIGGGNGPLNHWA